jgi:hypothetical protein
MHTRGGFHGDPAKPGTDENKAIVCRNAIMQSYEIRQLADLASEIW